MSPDELEDLHLRVKALLLEKAAASAKLGASTLRATVAMRQFSRAWTTEERREQDEVLFMHPDVVEMDMADAYWRQS